MADFVVIIECLMPRRTIGLQETDLSRSAFLHARRLHFACRAALDVLHWLPDVNDPHLLYRLQREYDTERDAWYARWLRGNDQREMLIAQKRLAQAIVALGKP